MQPPPALVSPPREAESRPPLVAVVVPCHNGAATVAKVVRDFRAALPEAQVLVVHNASTDGTAHTASPAGASVLREPRRGKGLARRTRSRVARGPNLPAMVHSPV